MRRFGSGWLKSNFGVRLDRTVTGKVSTKEDGSGMPGVNVVSKEYRKVALPTQPGISLSRFPGIIQCKGL
jgi:hypothetical protein